MLLKRIWGAAAIMPHDQSERLRPAFINKCRCWNRKYVFLRSSLLIINPESLFADEFFCTVKPITNRWVWGRCMSKLREPLAIVKVTMSGNHPNKSPGCLENKRPANWEVKGPGSSNNHQAPTQISNQQPGVLAVSEL